MAGVLCRPEAQGRAGAPPAHPAGATAAGAAQGGARRTQDGAAGIARNGAAAWSPAWCRAFGDPRRAERHARGSAGGQPASEDRHAEPARLDRPEGRADRRPGAGEIPGRGGAHEPQCRALFSVRCARALLRRVRLGGGQRHQHGRAGQRHALARRGAKDPDRRHPGHAGLGQRAGPRLPPQGLGRRRLSLHRCRRGREQEQGRGHSLSLLSNLAARHAQDAGILHPARGTDRRAGRCGPAGAQLCRPAQGRRHEDLQADRRLAGPDRQVLGGCPDPRPEDALSGDLQRHQGRQGPLSDRLPAQQRRHRPTRKPQQRDREQSVRRRQAGDPDRGLQGEARRQAVRPADRLGLVLFHHQAAVQAAALALPAVRQLRAGDSRHHRSRQGCLLPAGQQELRVRWPR